MFRIYFRLLYVNLSERNLKFHYLILVHFEFHKNWGYNISHFYIEAYNFPLADIMNQLNYTDPMEDAKNLSSVCLLQN